MRSLKRARAATQPTHSDNNDDDGCWVGFGSVEETRRYETRPFAPYYISTLYAAFIHTETNIQQRELDEWRVFGSGNAQASPNIIRYTRFTSEMEMRICVNTALLWSRVVANTAHSSPTAATTPVSPVSSPIICSVFLSILCEYIVYVQHLYTCACFASFYG